MYVETGSENVIVCSVQRFLRRDFDDTLSGQASFRYGSSRLGGLNLEEQKELGGLFFKKILLILEFTVIALITMWDAEILLHVNYTAWTGWNEKNMEHALYKGSEKLKVQVKNNQVEEIAAS